MEKNCFMIFGFESISRKSLEQRILRIHEIEDVVVVANIRQAGVLLKEHRIDVLIIMPECINYFNIIQQAKTCSPKIKIMVLSSAMQAEDIVNIIRLGISAFLSLEDALDNIRTHLDAMLCGDFPISPSIAKYALTTERRASLETTREPSVLSLREQDVLELMAIGHSRNDIAKSLQLSPHTVTTHIKHLYKKLGVHSRTEAVFVAQQEKILCLDHVTINSDNIA
ncbi:DNA-binding response regulator [Mariprofundus sp. EBB-1]|uniref:LuxR C-terminal-related transcriptional regulator n=1 Tax=Mariprofundus sp. EBB-1 TaxID=2650971 RepID=UPI000EF21810|nr:response regulator transcription factor [Mariprofundus sp. EBB-1]RLL50639.1 DNA-binding response regulator [Mariprofundus sp. EBB-1]